MLSTNIVHSAELAIGSFCLSGVSVQVESSDVSFTSTGRWTRFRAQYNRPEGTEATATVTVFEKAVRDDPNLPPDCVRMTRAAEEQGIGIIISGELERVRIVGRVGEGNANSFWIDSGAGGSLRISIRKVESGLRPVAGGQLDLGRNRGHAWIENQGEFLTTQVSTSGIFQIESYNPALLGSTVKNGTAETLVDFEVDQPNFGNLAIRVDMSNGSAVLWSGSLVTRDVRLSGSEASLLGISLRTVELGFQEIKIRIREGIITFTALTGDGQAASGDAALAAMNLIIGRTALNFLSASGNVEANPFEMRLLFHQARNLSVAAEIGTLHRDGLALVSGALRADITVWQSANITAELAWDRPEISSLPLRVAEGSGQQLILRLTGNPNAPNLDGEMRVSGFSIGGISIGTPARFSFRGTAGGEEITVPLRVDIGPSGGEIGLSDYDQRLVLRGEIRRVRLDARLRLPSDISKARVEVAPGGIEFNLAAVVSAVPWLAGTAPGFGEAVVEFRNNEPVTFGVSSSSGSIQFSTNVLVLGEPVLRIGDDAVSGRVALQLNLVGGAVFVYDASTGKLAVQRMLLRMTDTRLRFLEVNATVDIGGTLVTSPDIGLASLLIDVERERPGQPGRRIFEASGLYIQGALFERRRTQPTDTAWRGEPVAPFRVDRMTASVAVTEQSIAISFPIVTGLSLEMRNAEVSLGTDLRLEFADITLRVDQIRIIEEEEEGEKKRNAYLENARIDATGDLRESELASGLHLENAPRISNLEIVLSGRSDRVNGSGGFNLSSFMGTMSTEHEFDFQCRNGKRPKTTLSLRIISGGSVGALALRAVNGRFEFEGPLLPLTAFLLSTTETECAGRQEKSVITKAYQTEVKYPCFGTLNEPFRECSEMVGIPEFAIGYYYRFIFLGAAANLTIGLPYLRPAGRSQRICWVPTTLVTIGLTGISISPQIDGNQNMPQALEDLINIGIASAFTVAESTFVSALGTFGGLILNHPILAGTVCFVEKIS